MPLHGRRCFGVTRKFDGNMSIRKTDNPFELNKATDFTDLEIADYWVDILEEEGGLLNVLKPKLLTPTLLLGGKGSGKTHLMRYCSAQVQALRHNGDLLKAISSEGYLGLYVPAEGLNALKFSEKGQEQSAWSFIFAMYFELWIATTLLSVFSALADGGKVTFSESDFITDVKSLFDVDIDCDSTLDGFNRFLVSLRRRVDYVVNNSALNRTLSGLEIVFSHGRLAFGIPELLRKHVAEFENTTFVYLIDEAENFTIDQQKFLNTLIRYRKGNATIKVGARRYGIRTFETLGSGEPIRQDAEYETVVLDNFLRDQKDEYAKLARRLISKRLQKAYSPAPNTYGWEDLDAYFANLPRGNFWQEATLPLARLIDQAGKERPYFKRLKGYLSTAFKMSDGEANAVVRQLEMPDYPFIEKCSVFLLYRAWPSSGGEVSSICQGIASEAKNYVAGQRPLAPNFTRAVEYFSSDLLAQLFRDFRRRVPYAGLSNLIELSQGIPRNVLTILKHTYRRSLFAGELPFEGGVMSVDSQSDGVRDSSSWFWEDAQPDSNGSEVREAIEALALLFRTIRFSDRPAECDVCTFSVELEALSENSRRVIKMAENWSYLIKLRDGAKRKNDRGVGAKYQLGPMLAPKWDVSEHRRGNVELKTELADAIFDREQRGSLPFLIKMRVSGMMGPSFAAARQGGQEELF